MHRGSQGRRIAVIAVGALALGVFVAQIAAANGSSSHRAGAGGAVSLAKFKKLQKQVAALQAKVNALTLKPGPEGPQGPEGKQGPAGTAPACQGNGSGDTMVAAGAVCIDKYEVSV